MGVVLMEGFRYLPGVGSRISTIKAAGGVSTFFRGEGRAPGGYSIGHSNELVSDDTAHIGHLVIAAPGPNFTVGFSVYGASNWAGEADSWIAGLEGWVGGYEAFWLTLHPGLSILNGGDIARFVDLSRPWVPRSPDVITTGWQWMNVSVKWGSSTEGYVKVYRNGVLLAEMGPDTVTSTQDPLAAIRIYLGNSNASSGIRIGDLVVRDDLTLIPDSRVDVLSPVSTVSAGWDGSDGNRIDNHLLVDDAGPTVDSSDYVTSGLLGATDTYTFASLPHTPSTVSAVQVEAHCSRPNGGTGDYAMVANGVEGSLVNPGGGGLVHHIFETDPATGLPWSKGTVDSLTAGIRVKS